MNSRKKSNNYIFVYLFLIVAMTIGSCVSDYEKANLLNRQARSLLKKQAHNQAQEKYEKALECNKQSIEARIGLAKIHQQKGNAAQAYTLLSEFDIYSARETLQVVSKGLLANLENLGFNQIDVTLYYEYAQKKYAGRGVFGEKASALIDLIDFIAKSQELNPLRVENALIFIKNEIKQININEILANSNQISKHQLALIMGNNIYPDADAAWQSYVIMQNSIIDIKTKAEIKTLRYAKRNYAEDRKILFFHTVLNKRYRKLKKRFE